MSMIFTYVSVGAALLDEVRPDWAEEIDTDLLNMERTDSCVLGQLYKDFGIGVDELSRWTQEPWQWAIDHGFHTRGGELAWRTLRTTWLWEIQRRVA